MSWQNVRQNSLIEELQHCVGDGIVCVASKMFSNVKFYNSSFSFTIDKVEHFKLLEQILMAQEISSLLFYYAWIQSLWVILVSCWNRFEKE